MPETTRIGLIGAGTISAWHVGAIRDTPSARLAAICDTSETAARALADANGVPAFTSLDALIESGTCDAVHLLTPPPLHGPLAIKCLEAGLHVLAEKPVALSAAETREVAEAATRAGRRFHPGHNFLGLPSYARLKSMVAAGDLGRIAQAEIVWAFPLAPLRSGPYGLWLMQDPKNLLLELGPHLMAFAVDLFGPPEIVATDLSKPVTLPGGDTRPQSFRILARTGHTDVTITLSLVETVDDRSVTLRGSTGRARLDYAEDTLVVDRENASDLVLNRLRRQAEIGRAHLREGGRNAWTQLRSLNRRSPYAQSFRGMCHAIYDNLHAPDPDPRYSATATVAVMQAVDDVLALVPPDRMAPAAPAARTRDPKPTALVIGGTGYIGRALTRDLVSRGRDVRVLSRGRHGPFPDLPDRVETVGASLHDRAALLEAMQGIDHVYNLARALGTSWEDCLENDVAPALAIAEAALEAGVKRLVYTGTIASYDMSDRFRKITEATGFAADMSDRNLYARSKAECEARLMAMHRERGLPLTIARPGIVVGADGPLQHWGLARWHGAGAARIWGPGTNRLPFVLIDDVTDGLIRMAESDAALGEDFNLVGDPMLSANGYFDALHRATGARLRISRGNLTAFWAADAVKYLLKRHALGRRDAIRPSRADWQSRAHFSQFSNAKPKEMLGWRPEDDPARFEARAFASERLFGF